MTVDAPDKIGGAHPGLPYPQGAAGNSSEPEAAVTSRPRDADAGDETGSCPPAGAGTGQGPVAHSSSAREDDDLLRLLAAAEAQDEQEFLRLAAAFGGVSRAQELVRQHASVTRLGPVCEVVT